jgi:hypothetical protein
LFNLNQLLAFAKTMMQLGKLVPTNNILFRIYVESRNRHCLLVCCSTNPPKVYRVRLEALGMHEKGGCAYSS